MLKQVVTRNDSGEEIKCVEFTLVLRYKNIRDVAKKFIGLESKKSKDINANIEKAYSPADKEDKQEYKELIKVETPNVKTIEELVEFFNTDKKKFAKTILFNVDGLQFQ
jgi:hypothetical protein